MAVKFETDVPLTLDFPFGDFRPIEGQYGPQFLYTTEREGTRDRLYATPLLHQHLQEAQVGPGARFTITKTAGENNRTRWTVQSAVPELETPSEETSVPVNGSPTAGTNGHTAVSHPDFEVLKQLMKLALNASWEAWYELDDQANYGSEDVRAVGITLFLECARKGVLPQAAVAAEDAPF